MSSYSPAVSTPPRDRFPSTASQASPQKLANVPGNGQTVTVEALLASHSSSSDPKYSALEQAVSERNSLSAQNAQLWKLIEKQRSGYNHLLKELERVRSERDGYKARAGQPVNPERRRHHSQDRTSSRNADVTEENGDDLSSESSGENKGIQKPVVVRANSDNQSSSSRHALQSSRSQDAIHGNQPSVPSSTLSQSLPPSSSNSHPQRPSKTPLAPLTVPARSESLPVTAPPHASSPDGANNPHVSLPYHAPSDSITSNASYNTTKPLTYVRKTSVTSDSQPHVHAPGGIAMQNHNHSHHGLGENNSSMSHSLTGKPTASSPLSAPNNNLTVAHVDSASRDSRISLPDEAKKYIAAMGDSPIPSPKPEPNGMKVNGPRAINGPEATQTVTGLGKSSNLSEPKSGFLDMDDEELGAEEEEDVPETERYEMLPAPAQDTQQRNPLRSTADDFPLPPVANPQPPSTQLYGSGYSVSPPNHSQHAMASSTSLSSDPTRQPISSAEQLDSESDSTHYHQQPPQQSLPPLRPQRLDTEPQSVPANFRALPLLTSDLPHTKIQVLNSFVRPNDRGKEVLSFVIIIHPGNGKDSWKVEKMYSDVLNLDQRVRNSVRKEVAKKMGTLPEGKLWKDHAPAKVDQRKAVLEAYLQSLINLPVKGNDEVIAFFTSDIVRETKQPVMQMGHKEGYLTKRGKNFGGWKTRYFVLSGPVLEYFDTRGGARLGSILITGAQIGRQQRTDKAPNNDDEKEYRHAFLIVEAKKGPGGSHPRHVLCAESDADRDSWVEMLVRYFSGTYSEEPVSYGQPVHPSTYAQGNNALQQSSRPSVDSRRPVRAGSKDDAVMQPYPMEMSTSKPFQGVHDEYARSASPTKPVDTSPTDRFAPSALTDAQMARRLLERGQGQPSSLPDSSPLSQISGTDAQRAASELGHYPDIQDGRPQQSPDQHKGRDATNDNSKNKVKISGPMNGALIPEGYKFGGSSQPVEPASTPDRREKAKSRGFWGFGRPNGDKPQNAQNVTFVPRSVFGVTIEESLDVAQIANLPAIVFRCIQYLEAKNADQEEGIYRLSGSSAVIKSLKDRFNLEGDVDLLASDEYWDPHAIAGLLKSYFRELPASILTRDLHLKFLSVMDYVNPPDRIKELAKLVGALPTANYCLLRALSAHLLQIVGNSAVNKMTMRNVGIVFSPTLGIPAGVFSLMLGEFDHVFQVNGNSKPDAGEPEAHSVEHRRNSQHYASAGVDQMLGLSGRTINPDDNPSDGDSVSIHLESEPDMEEGTAESSASSFGGGSSAHEISVPDTPTAAKSKASSTAAARGLNVNVGGLGQGHTRSPVGLPMSPRPPPSPGAHASPQ